MINKVAVIDVDGVIYDYITKLADIASVHLDKPRHHFPPSTKWYFFEDWGLDKQEYFELVDVATTEYDLISVGDPFPGSTDGWNILRQNNIHIHIATACGGSGEPDAHLRQASRAMWLKKHGFEYDEITFTKDKAAVAQLYLDKGKEVYAVDDSVDNFKALEATGAHTYLLNQAWNEFYPTQNRVNNMVDFANTILSNNYQVA